MARNRPTAFHIPPPAHAIKPLENLERLQAVYFFTPDLEREINKLDSVTSCRVLSTGAEIEEVHVMAPPDHAPKKVVRDVESLLLLRFGIRIDHRRVSVGHSGQTSTPSAASLRPRFVKIEKHTTGAGEEVCVEIKLNGHITAGIAHAEAGESDLQVSSRAVLHALNELLNTGGTLSARDISMVRIGNQEIVLSRVSWTLGGQEEVLVGATPVRGDPLEGAARATFDAVNRKLVL